MWIQCYPRVPAGKLFFRRKRTAGYLIGFFFILSAFSSAAIADSGWSKMTVRLLPESAFAVVEKTENGARLRRCPHHDAGGNLEAEQLVYVLGTLHRIAWLSKEAELSARRHLNNHYQELRKELRKNPLEELMDINSAHLSDLVRLPGIGPVIAVKILEYRSVHLSFDAPEQIQEVGGIGRNLFMAIRHYIVAK